MDLFSIFIGSMIVLAIGMISIFAIILLGELQLKKARKKVNKIV
jgi:cytochrome oxidase assembly protein ShyY1